MTADGDPFDLDALEQVAQAATPGPWSVDRNTPFSDELVGVFCEAQKRYVVEFEDQSWADTEDEVREQDAAYIAAADPTTILNLLAELRGHREAELRVRDLCTSGRIVTPLRVLAALDGTRGDG